MFTFNYKSNGASVEFTVESVKNGVAKCWKESKSKNSSFNERLYIPVLSLLRQMEYIIPKDVRYV